MNAKSGTRFAVCQVHLGLFVWVCKNLVILGMQVAKTSKVSTVWMSSLRQGRCTFAALPHLCQVHMLGEHRIHGGNACLVRLRNTVLTCRKSQILYSHARGSMPPPGLNQMYPKRRK